MLATTPLIGFSGEVIWPIGQIQLLVKIGDEEHSASAWINFVVVRSPSPYNGIIGRLGVRKLLAVPSTAHRMLKIPKPADMTGVLRIAEHRLNVGEGCSPVRQKKRGQAADRNHTIQEEVGKLVEAGIMRKVHYHDWLSNPIDRNLEVYVDDLVIKSRTEDEIVKDIEETSKTLREINMKLNLKKCTFGVEEGMFLGYKVNAKGLKVCPDKVDAVLSLPSLKYLNDKSDFHWTTEAKEAFKQMKQLIAELPMLTAPMEKEELIVYLAVARETISAVLMTEREAKQMPIYFVSRALRGPELNYTSIEKLVLALVHASKHLKRPRVSVKGQILADFIVERPKEDSSDTPMEVEENLSEPWILFTDGSSYTDGSGAGLILTNPEGMEFTYALRFSFAHLSKQVLVEELKEKSISEVEVLAVVEEEGDTWMTPIFKYLMEETLPTNMKKVRAIRRKSWRFAIINGILYKKSFLGLWLSMHSGTRFVVAKALRTGYYWPTMQKDARTLIRACQDCQVHKPVPRNPQQKLTPITSPWPFYKWGINIAIPFPEGPGKVKFLIVAMDYFTKWIEAKPVATITVNHIKKFMWDNIVCWFGIPGEIISDNGKQFQDDPFKDWCKKLCIYQHFASVKHPQTNGLVERENHSLGDGIKARTEAIIPAEIGMPTLRTAEVDLVQNNEALEINLDLLEERREEAAIREAKSKAKMEKFYNAKVRNTSFKPGDLVYRNNDASQAKDTRKLGPK
ncbi:reverse transcriptase domain-containing protein [Tanacetum coccineum]